jgi:hypothetical protein
VQSSNGINEYVGMLFFSLQEVQESHREELDTLYTKLQEANERVDELEAEQSQMETLRYVFRFMHLGRSCTATP